MIFSSGLGEKVGLLGGTFDPVHNGHLAAAEEVKKALNLDAVLIIPAPQPPHKIGQHLSSYEDRVAMLDCALKGKHGFFISRIEADRPAPSYTIDTLKILQANLAENVSLFFILGLDSFMELETWKEYESLPQYAHLVVIDRPTFSVKDFSKKVRMLYDDFQQDKRHDVWSQKKMSGKIYHLKITTQNISSTEIREMVYHGQTITGMVPGCVEKYIHEHKLYTKS